MKKTYSLFIDESGEISLKRAKESPYFILSGFIVPDHSRSDIKNFIDHIKYKHWAEDFRKIAFHSMEIGRQTGHFNLFNNPDTLREFSEDIKRFFNFNSFEIISVVLDKNKLIKSTWKETTIYKKCFTHILDSYIKLLILRDATGRVCAEASNDYQDIALYKSFFTYQAYGIPFLSITHDVVKKRMTSLSFVTKHNRDTEEEIVDLIGYGIRLDREIKTNVKSMASLSVYDKAILKGVQSKMLYVGSYTDIEKLKISKTIKPLLIIPKKRKTG